MANIVLSANTTSINVDTTTSTVDVSSTISNVIVGDTTFVANNLVRAAISVANNGGDGSLSYDEPTGVITYNGVTAAETRAHFSGSNGVDYNSSTGAITADSAEIRALLSNVAPITYNASTGVIGLEQTLDDLTLKKYQETVVANGILSGDISLNIADGTIHQVTLVGDITGITLGNISTGGSATILLTQDGIGGSTLDTTTTPSNWTNWNFTNEFTSLDATADAWSALNVLYDGSEYYATVITGSGTIDNATLEIIKAYIETNGLDMGNTVTSNSNISSTANISANTFKGIGLESQGALDVKFNAYGYFNTDTFSVSNSGGVLTNTFQLASGGAKYFRVGSDGTYGGDGQVQTGSLKIYGDSSGGGQTSLVIDSGNAVIAGVISAGSLATDTHTFTGNVDVTGNIEVSGNLNYRNVEDLYVRDQSITLNANAATNATVEIIANRPQNTSTLLRWHEDAILPQSKWKFTNDGTTFYDIPTSTTDLAEGTNLYYTDGRFDTRLGTKSTTDLAEGTNLYYTQGRFDTAFTAKSTTDLSEGTNLYYTDARFDTRLGTKSTSDLAEGTNLYYTDTRSRAALSVTTAAASGDGALAYNSGTGVFTFTPADAGLSDYGNVQVADFLANGFGSNTITTTGNISASYFIGDGSLLTNISGANVSTVDQAKTVVKTVIAGEDLAKGDAVYISGGTGDNPEVSKADADDAAKMPVFGVTTEVVTATNTTDLVIYGLLESYDTTGFTTGDSLFVSTTAGALTTTKPTGESALLQTVGKVIKGNSAGGKITITGAGRTNATPNLNDGNIFIGNGSNESVTTSFTDEANSAIAAYTGDMLSVADIVANTLLTSNAITSQSDITSQTKVLIGQQSNTAIGGVRAFEGVSTFTNFSTSQPAINVENGFLTIQASDETSNVFSIPRYALGKLPDVPAVTSTTVDEYGLNGYTYDNVTYAMPGGVEAPTGVITSTVNKRRAYALPAYLINYTSEGATPHSTGTIQFGTDNSNVTVRAKNSFGPIAGTAGYLTAPTANGTITFRTVQTDILADLDTIAPYNEAVNFANSTVAYMNHKFNIGREDDGTSYSFPKTAGNANEYLRISGTGGELEFVNAFAGLVNDQGTVIGDVTIDIANGDIHKIETAGNITDLIVSNIPLGTRATIIIKQGTTTGALTGSTNWLWAGGNKTLSTTTGDIDVIEFFRDDSSNYFAKLNTGYVA